MTIWLFTGTPGSGKSYHAVLDVMTRLKKRGKKNALKQSVMTNFFVDTQHPGYKLLLPDEITPDFFYDYALQNHTVGMEGQTLVILDEAGTIFNSRDWGSNSNKRMEWIKFFSMHRHYGYNFILIAQMDRMIDRQIRGLIEYEVSHNKINNYWAMLPVSMFLAVERWYGQKLKIGHKVILYNPKIAKLYNSFAIFEHAKNSIEHTKESDRCRIDYIEHTKTTKKHASKIWKFLSGQAWAGGVWVPAQAGGPTTVPAQLGQLPQAEPMPHQADGIDQPAAPSLVAPTG